MFSLFCTKVMMDSSISLMGVTVLSCFSSGALALCFRPPPEALGLSALFSSISPEIRSRRINLLQALVRARGVLDSPIPITYICASRRRIASLVKSLSLVTRQKPSTFPE